MAVVAKGSALSAVKMPLGCLPKNSVVRKTDHARYDLKFIEGCKTNLALQASVLKFDKS